MDKKLVIILVFLLTASLLIMKITRAQTTVVYIKPQLTTIEEIGKTFEINVSISQVIDLASWEFKLYYESSVLNATDITEGPFLKTAGETTGLIPFNFTDSYNATHGRIWFACTLTGQGLGANGNGTLAKITFKVKGPGVANLHLADTDLLDSKMSSNRIGHTTIDGIVKTVVAIQGDFNADGTVDGSDFYILLQAWGTTPPSDPRADANGDGTVDGSDFYILLVNWGKSNP